MQLVSDECHFGSNSDVHQICDVWQVQLAPCDSTWHRHDGSSTAKRTASEVHELMAVITCAIMHSLVLKQAVTHASKQANINSCDFKAKLTDENPLSTHEHADHLFSRLISPRLFFILFTGRSRGSSSQSDCSCFVVPSARSRCTRAASGSACKRGSPSSSCIHTHRTRRRRT